MSARTKKDRRNALMNTAGRYGAQLTVAMNGVLDQCNEWGRDQVFWSIFPYRKELFLKTATLDEAESLPAAHMRFARDASVEISSVKYPFRYTGIMKVPQMKTNYRTHATNTEPVLYFADQKVHYLPNAAMVTKFAAAPYNETLTAVASASYSYYAYPTYSDDTEDATDEMPEDVEPLIVRAGCERLMLMVLSNQEAYGLLAEQRQQWAQSRERLFEDAYTTNQNDIRRGN